MGFLEEFAERAISQLENINDRLDRLEERSEYNTDVQMLTVKEVSEDMSSSPSHVYKLMREFGLPYIEAGKAKKLIPRREYIEWIEKNTVRSAEDLDKRLVG